MTKEKQEGLSKYLSKLVDRMSSPVPEKHKDHPETFKNFLAREIKVVKEQLDLAKLEGGSQ